MKKLLTLAVMATLLTAGSAFAQWGRHAVAQPNATFAFAAGSGLAPGPSTTNNDDSCDIGVTPAATLLLPYFEVETSARAVDTFFTITNTSRVPQIAHVTVWTDWSFPVLDFNIFLTGYDVQPLSMYDIIVNGSIAPTATGGIGGTSSSTSKGSLSLNNLYGNPNFFGWTATGSTIGCTGLPGAIPPGIRSAVQSALVTGIYNATGFASSCGTVNSVGSPASDHATPTTAVGYVTVDVANRCSTTLPTDPAYYNSEMLYDNTLIGDYQILNKAAGSNYAGGNPLVHIRAIPEGGPAGSIPGTLAGSTTPTNLPWTFYSRYNTGVTGVVPNPAFMDRRQPLPSVFAARWIQGGANSFNTAYRIWREGVTGAGVNTAVGVIPTDCLDVYLNGAIPIAEIVRFDEHEDYNTYSPGVVISPNVPSGVTLPETKSISTSDGTFPPATFTGLGVNDVGGWMYLNLNSVSGAGTATSGTATGAVNDPSGAYADVARPSQNWVIVSMAGAGSTAGLFGVDFDAAWLGNGCSGPVGLSNANSGSFNIGPVGGTPVCPASTTCVAGATYPGTNVTP